MSAALSLILCLAAANTAIALLIAWRLANLERDLIPLLETLNDDPTNPC